MIQIKTSSDIKKMEEGGRILGEVLSAVLKKISAGVSEIEVDRYAEKLILERGAKPGFKMVKGYNYSLCISTNDIVVHGIPSDYKFQDGDVVGIDCGVFYKGFHTDMSETVRVSTNKKKDKIDKFLKIGGEALDAGISQALAGNRVGNISKSIQKIVEKEGYSVVRSLIGHGVGKDLHEEPEVPGYLTGAIKNTPLLKEGMTLAIEVIYSMGGPDVVYKNEDGWTISTKDTSISGLFERTVLVTDKGPRILTNLVVN